MSNFTFEKIVRKNELYIKREKKTSKPMGLPIQTKLALQLLALAVALPSKGFSVFNFFNGGKYKFLKNTDFT